MMNKKIMTLCAVLLLSFSFLVGFDTQNQPQQPAQPLPQSQEALLAQQQLLMLTMPDPVYGLRGILSLDEIPVVGVMTNEDSSTYNQVVNGIEAGKYEKIRYIASNGDQFCMWNVRLSDKRTYGSSWDDKEYYYWFMAPLGQKFSDKYNYCNMTGTSAADADKYVIAIGRNVSSSINESMLNRNPNIPLQYRVINTPECPVPLYQIIDEGNKVYVWVESTNCIEPGIGTCGTRYCTNTCLRSKTLETFWEIPSQKGWRNYIGGGEGGRISWNGKLLVNFCYLKG